MRASRMGAGALRATIATIVALLLASTAHAAGNAVPALEAQVLSIDGVNLRRDPRPDAPIVAVAEGGDFVALFDEVSADRIWRRVAYDEIEGWAAARYLGTPRAIKPGARTSVKRGFTTEIGARLPAPYRSQLDGSAYEAGNCGPTSVAMALGAFGIHVATTEIRSRANRLQGTTGIHDSGTAPEVLAYIAEQHGLVARGLFAGRTYDRWSFAEVRQALRNGHLVIPQVHLASLPGQERANRAIDHFVVIFGYEEERFLYHDPAFPGWKGHSLWITEDHLKTAWQRSDHPFAAFSLGPGRGLEPLIVPEMPGANEPPATPIDVPVRPIVPRIGPLGLFGELAFEPPSGGSRVESAAPLAALLPAARTVPIPEAGMVASPVAVSIVDERPVVISAAAVAPATPNTLLVRGAAYVSWLLVGLAVLVVAVLGARRQPQLESVRTAEGRNAD